MTYLWHILAMVALYAILAMSLDLVVGYGGILSLCQAAFYGVGAYAAALSMLRAGWSFPVALTVAGLLSAGLGLVTAAFSLRLRGDFLILATLGVQMLVSAVLANWIGVTGGPYGIPGIPAPGLFSREFSPWGPLAATAVVMAAGTGLLVVLVRSPFGRSLQAVRDDQVAAAALGKSPFVLRTAAFTISAGLAGVAGALFSSYMRYIDPGSFGIAESVLILSMVIVGGAGSLMGPAIGAAVLVILPEVLRFLGLPEASAAQWRLVLYGGLIVLLMRWRPQGFLGDYGFD